jgi:hypothetical protein
MCACECDTKEEHASQCLEEGKVCMVSWSDPRLPYKLGDPGSTLARTSTQCLRIIESAIPIH